MVKLISDLKDEGYMVDYLPFYHGRDEKIVEDVQRALNSSDRVLQYGKDFALQDIDELFASYDIGVCMKFHAVLLAVKNSLPCLAICYDHKSEQLLKEAGLSEYGVRYGIRTSEFFGEERDLDSSVVNNIMKKVKTDSIDFVVKSKAFAASKQASVNDNYRIIFEEILR